jgi:2-polyprenyl-6-methoxyphenol hydroxylase-like FAD-dependent oxidoreductase
MDVIIVGGGIGGLTLALTLHERGISSRIFESAPEMRPIGVGINLLPHATRELERLGVLPALETLAVATREAVFYNRFGQRIYGEPLGRGAGYSWPQLSIHRADLHSVLTNAVKERLDRDAFVTGWHCTHTEHDGTGAMAHFRDSSTGATLAAQRAALIVACDGLHSVVRKELHPHEGAPLYAGVNMWRGVTRWKPILGGASMIRAGWLKGGKLVIYPIRNNVDAEGRQLVNWVAEIETPKHLARDWNRAGRIEDFIAAFEDWRFDWLDVPSFLRASDMILEFPMVDQDPLPWWSKGRITLLGDAAHPMVPRGSNGAGQAILDARALADCVAQHPEPEQALKAYEDQRLEATASVVRMNRRNPPDAILREVFLRTGDRPFARIEDVMSIEEMRALTDAYKRVAGYDHASMR